MIRDVEGGVEIDVLVVPRASRTKVVGEHEGRLKVQLSAPPVDGAANAALIDLLADVFGVKKKNVEIVSGDTGRRKRVRVSGVVAAEIARVIGA